MPSAASSSRRFSSQLRLSARPWPCSAPERFLVPLQLAHGGQQCPAQAVLQPYITLAAGNIGFQADPAFEHAAGQARFAFELPVVRLGGLQAAFQHVANVGLAFEGDQVPAEQHQVTPVAVVGEQLKRAIDVALRQALAEAFDPGGQLFGGRAGDSGLAVTAEVAAVIGFQIEGNVVTGTHGGSPGHCCYSRGYRACSRASGGPATGAPRRIWPGVVSRLPGRGCAVPSPVRRG